jgi:hypothetical protein
MRLSVEREKHGAGASKGFFGKNIAHPSEFGKNQF